MMGNLALLLEEDAIVKLLVYLSAVTLSVSLLALADCLQCLA